LLKINNAKAVPIIESKENVYFQLVKEYFASEITIKPGNFCRKISYLKKWGDYLPGVLARRRRLKGP